MATYKVKYVYDGKENCSSVTAISFNAAKNAFIAMNPHVTAESVLDISMMREDAFSSFVENLFTGNLGLAMTYWVYGVLGGIVWVVAIFSLNPEPEGDLIKLVWGLFACYYFVVYVGVWKAANKYIGSKVWAVLAKFAVIVVALPIAIHLLKWLTT
ncbi:MAG: hypothetical protein PHP85_10055 [Gallionella sp.]|nr:hypothetical protein [Gallionella sp.]